MSAYVFVRIEKSRLVDIQRLYQSSFGLSVSLASLEAKYSTGNFGGEYIGYIVYSAEGDPAAYYGVFPLVISVGGVSMLVGQSGDTMTAPAHRMKGLFVEAARRTYELALNEGLEFVFGFPNENSLPGFKSKLGWMFTDSLFDFRLETGGVPLAAFAKRFRIFRSSLNKLIDARLRRLRVPISDGLIEEFSASIADSVLHDRNFFEYKLNNGSEVLSWKGFTWFVKIDGDLLIGDVALFDPEQFGKFLDACRSLGRYLYCHRILFTVNKNHWLFRLFQAFEISGRESLPVGFLPLGQKVIPFNSISFSRLDADTF
jgi:hypothetical protein